MNLTELQKKLLAAARTQSPDGRVPYAFEKRVLAQLAARAGADQWVVWARGLGRAAGACVLLALLCGVVSLFLPRSAENANDLSQDFENTLLASVDQGETMP
jgi:hypothetical protein